MAAALERNPSLLGKLHLADEASDRGIIGPTRIGCCTYNIYEAEVAAMIGMPEL
jgi:hypothetical protein